MVSLPLHSSSSFAPEGSSPTQTDLSFLRSFVPFFFACSQKPSQRPSSPTTLWRPSRRRIRRRISLSMDCLGGCWRLSELFAVFLAESREERERGCWRPFPFDGFAGVFSSRVHSTKPESPFLYLNSNTPLSAVICGVRRSVSNSRRVSFRQLEADSSGFLSSFSAGPRKWKGSFLSPPHLLTFSSTHSNTRWFPFSFFLPSLPLLFPRSSSTTSVPLRLPPPRNHVHQRQTTRSTQEPRRWSRLPFRRRRSCFSALRGSLDR